jgi:tetratricopeptide (TPR) repeat protein
VLYNVVLGDTEQLLQLRPPESFRRADRDSIAPLAELLQRHRVPATWFADFDFDFRSRPDAVDPAVLFQKRHAANRRLIDALGLQVDAVANARSSSKTDRAGSSRHGRAAYRDGEQKAKSQSIIRLRCNPVSSAADTSAGSRQMKPMAGTVFAELTALVIASAITLAAKNTARRAPVVDPFELSGPPKKPPVVTPALRAFVGSPTLKDLGSKDPKVLATAVRSMTSLIQQYPNESDFYFLRANVSCMVHGNKDETLNDVGMSLKLRAPGKTYIYDSPRDAYTLKAKVEFDLGRYEDAMSDLDAAIRVDFTNAAQVFNDGNVKPNQPTATPCAWTSADINTLAGRFPKDFRPPLYRGLYLLVFTGFSLDADYKPVMDAFARAAALNPTSALPPYFSADPYIVGGIGGLISKKSSVCIDDIVPRSTECLTLDDTHRTGLRFLTQAIAADPTFEPAYARRGLAHYLLRENRQAVRDYTKAIELNPEAGVYGDRALAEVDLKEYQPAIHDYTKAIEQGCKDTLCPTYENRANLYLKLHDYPHAISDISHVIRNFLDGTIFGFNIDQFRRIYPEYDDVADDVLCEKLRLLFNPQMNSAVYSKQFLVEAKEVDDFVLPDLFLKRGDAYADSGDIARANREYDRVSAGYPKWAKNAFTTTPDGKRVRVRQ